MDDVQYELYEATATQRAEDWIHTPEGGKVVNRFIRIAWGCQKRGIKVGQRAIWERIRWNYRIKRGDGQRFAMNDHYLKPVLWFVYQRVPELKGYFNMRTAPTKKRRAVVVDITPRTIRL